jgi:hypothetical protein
VKAMFRVIFFCAWMGVSLHFISIEVQAIMRALTSVGMV